MFKQLSNIRTKLFAEIISIPEALQPSHLPGLDGLRGVAIIIVIIGHLFWESNLRIFIGFAGVDIFFVISGFLITTILLKEKVNKGSISLRFFYIRRILRIMPVAYLYIFILILLNIIFKLNIPFRSFATAVLYLKNIPFKNSGEWFTGHFWSLSVEEQFYLIFPIFLVCYQKKYIQILCFTVILIELAEYFGYINWGGREPNSIIHYILFFIINLFGKGTIEILIGSLTSILLFKNIINLDGLKTSYLFSLIILILAFLIDTFLHNYPISSIFFSISISFVILNNLYRRDFLVSILSNKILVKIGILSYSIYIWQQLFVRNQPWAQSFKYSDSIVLNLILLGIVVTVSYYFYEKQFLQLKNKYRSKPIPNI